MNTKEPVSEMRAVAPEVKKPQVLWLIVVGVAVVGTYAALFIPALAGESIGPNPGFASMLWTGLFFFLWWRRRGHQGWKGALVGALLGLLVFGFAGFISGAMRGA